MDVTTACIAGEEIFRQLREGRIEAQQRPALKTPFGESAAMLLVADGGAPFYLLPRYLSGFGKTAVNYRANMYALKELGVRQLLAWAPGGAISHNLAIGDLVVLDDLIDQTYLRAKTFFEQSPLGYLRQWPVFCPALRQAAAAALAELKLPFHDGGVVAVCEGPRLETPAEVRMLANAGAQIVTHGFVPEVFLAKELELCYGAICYVVNYAETGSRHRPFSGKGLFGTQLDPDHGTAEGLRLTTTVQSLADLTRRIAGQFRQQAIGCECGTTMQSNIRRFNLPADWHKWFGEASPKPE
jgi:5'-methylthioadenosine phosphorylase